MSMRCKDMVNFFVYSKDADEVVYKYYPENHTNKDFGLIRVSIDRKDITLDKVAEEDFLCKVSAEKFNKMRDAIYEMQIENREEPFSRRSGQRLLEGEEWYYYADHVIRRLREELDKGIIPEKV